MEFSRWVPGPSHEVSSQGVTSAKELSEWRQKIFSFCWRSVLHTLTKGGWVKKDSKICWSNIVKVTYRGLELSLVNSSSIHGLMLMRWIRIDRWFIVSGWCRGRALWFDIFSEVKGIIKKEILYPFQFIWTKQDSPKLGACGNYYVTFFMHWESWFAYESSCWHTKIAI